MLKPKKQSHSRAAMRLKVAYITMRFPLPSETFALNDVQALIDEGLDITVLPIRKGTDLRTQNLLAQYGIPQKILIQQRSLFRLGWKEILNRPGRCIATLFRLLALNLRRPKTLMQTLWLYPSAIGAALWCDSNKVDIAHLRWGHHPAMVGLIIKQWGLHPKVSLSLSAYDLEIDLPVTAHLIKHADAIRTLGLVNVEPIARRYNLSPSSITTIYNSLPDDVLDTALDKYNNKTLAKSPGLILTAGRLVPSKRTDAIIRLFARIAPDYPAARLEIIGDGPDYARLRSLVLELGLDNRVGFTGILPYREVLAKMRKADLFVMLSAKSSERLPNVVKEAMASYCAVISTDSPGISELIDHGHSGLIVPTDDSAAAESALRSLLDNPRYATQLALNGYQHMYDNFRLSVAAKQYVSMWTELLEFTLPQVDQLK